MITGLLKKVSLLIYQKLMLLKVLKPDGIRKIIFSLEGGTMKQTEKAVENYYIQLISKVVVVITITIMISAPVFLYTVFNRDNTVHIVRNDYGEDGSTYTLHYEDGEKQTGELIIDVDAVQYKPEDLHQIFDEAIAYIEQEMPGTNSDLSEIQSDLYLVDKVPQEGVAVNWTSSDYELISSDGKVHNHELTGPETVWLTLELTCQEEVKQKTYTVVVLPDSLTSKDAEREEIEQLIYEQLEKQKYEKEVSLTFDSEDRSVRVTNTQNNAGVTILLLGIVIASCLVYQQKNKLKELACIRKKQFLQEYPGLVNQIVLYTSAGISIPGAFDKIIRRREEEGNIQSVLYQELKRMQNELATGVPHEQAYLHFGKRVGVLPYIKLMSLLLQQISRGGSGIAQQLEQEEHEAFEKRKERAKQYGEEAGTKLLFPMILLMVISMLIIIYPAIAGFFFGAFGSM